MKIYAPPGRADALLFDVDETLYTHKAFARAQIRGLLERLARLRGADPDALEAEIEAFRARWAMEHGGRKISLGIAFTHFGVSIEESVRWREEIVRPEDWLDADPRLREALRILSAKAALAVVTNNPVSVGRRTLAALGVSDLFRAVVGLDSCHVSKPGLAPFLAAAAALGVEPGRCMVIGDRYDIDIAPALELGMGGVLVESVSEVYSLPEKAAEYLNA